jgi:hypothetical protein
MSRFYQPDLGSEPDSPFARDANDKLIRRGCWLDMNDRSLVLARTQGLGARCSVPECEGIRQTDPAFREALWARYFMAAPRPRTPSELRYSATGSGSEWSPAGHRGSRRAAQRMLAEGDDDSLFLGRQDCRARSFRPHGNVVDEGPFAPLRDCLAVQPVLCGKLFERSLRSPDCQREDRGQLPSGADQGCSLQDTHCPHR